MVLKFESQAVDPVLAVAGARASRRDGAQIRSIRYDGRPVDLASARREFVRSQQALRLDSFDLGPDATASWGPWLRTLPARSYNRVVAAINAPPKLRTPPTPPVFDTPASGLADRAGRLWAYGNYFRKRAMGFMDHAIASAEAAMLSGTQRADQFVETYRHGHPALALVARGASAALGWCEELLENDAERLERFVDLEVEYADGTTEKERHSYLDRRASAHWQLASLGAASYTLAMPLPLLTGLGHGALALGAGASATLSALSGRGSRANSFARLAVKHLVVGLLSATPGLSTAVAAETLRRESAGLRAVLASPVVSIDEPREQLSTPWVPARGVELDAELPKAAPG